MEQRKREPGESKAPKQASMPPRRIWVAFLAALLANFLVMRLFFPSADEINPGRLRSAPARASTSIVRT